MGKTDSGLAREMITRYKGLIAIAMGIQVHADRLQGILPDISLSEAKREGVRALSG